MLSSGFSFLPDRGRPANVARTALPRANPERTESFATTNLRQLKQIPSERNRLRRRICVRIHKLEQFRCVRTNLKCSSHERPFERPNGEALFRPRCCCGSVTTMRHGPRSTRPSLSRHASRPRPPPGGGRPTPVTNRFFGRDRGGSNFRSKQHLPPIFLHCIPHRCW